MSYAPQPVPAEQPTGSPQYEGLFQEPQYPDGLVYEDEVDEGW